MSTTANSKHHVDLLVLVADALSARLLRREADGTLLEVWKIYGVPATAESVDLAAKAFVSDISDRLREVSDVESTASAIVVAPHKFGDALRDGFGATLWKRVNHYVPRNVTGLSETGLRLLVEETVGHTR